MVVAGDHVLGAEVHERAPGARRWRLQERLVSGRDTMGECLTAEDSNARQMPQLGNMRRKGVELLLSIRRRSEEVLRMTVGAGLVDVSRRDEQGLRIFDLGGLDGSARGVAHGARFRIPILHILNL